MNNNTIKTLKLKRKDGKIVDAVFYDNSDIQNVEILNIKDLHFEGMKTKDITKTRIREFVFKNKKKLYLKNNRSGIIAIVPRKHLTKIISTIFKRDIESRHTYLKKEIISNIDMIFYAAIPILSHPEIKSEILYEDQIIHRFAIPIKIGGIIFFVMITVKERTDHNETSIEKFTIYDLYSETKINKKPFDSSSTASVGINPMTTRSQYQTITYSINDLTEFVKGTITHYWRQV